jgi:hypothetical protein
MTHNLLSPSLSFVVVAVVGLLAAPDAGAQSFELTPFGGYRFGWGVSDVGGAPVIDDDGGGSFGMIANIALSPRPDDFKFEALFSREQARVTIQPTFFSPPLRAITTVDHMMIGVIQELDPSAQRAFISALAGVTRYAAAGDTEFRFTIGLGAGGKFFATRHVGLRLDARGYMTIIELAGTGICSGGCVFGFRANPVFQADVTAGFIVAF